MPIVQIQPFTVGEVVLTSLDALLSAAALNLGEAMPDGRTLAKPDPQEAWYALLAASGLLGHVGALMKESAHRQAENRLATLSARLAELYPTRDFPVPAHLTSTIG